MRNVTMGKSGGMMAFLAVIFLIAGNIANSQPALNFKRINVIWPSIELHFQVSCQGVAKYDLDASKFRVFDTGNEITGVTVTCPDLKTRCPISTALVFDESSSMSPNGRMAVVSSGHAFIDMMDGVVDQAAVFGFGDKVDTLCLLTTSKFTLHDAVDKVRASGRTALWDGVYAGLREIGSNGTNPCRALIVMTDGGDNQSMRDTTGFIAYANSHGIRIFTVAIGALVDAQILEALAVQTDGKFYLAPSPGDVSSIILEIATIIFQGFPECVLTYQGSCKDGSMHIVDLQVNDVCSGSDIQTKTFRAPRDSTTFTKLDIGLGDADTYQNSDVSVPLTLGTNPNALFQTGGFAVKFNASVLQYSGITTPPGTLLAGIPITVTPIAGGMAFRITQNRVLTDTGTLALLSFRTTDMKKSTQSTLALQNWLFDAGCFSPVLKNGTVSISTRKISCTTPDSGYLSFGKVGIGLRRTRVVTISNINPNALFISSVAITGTDAAKFSVVYGSAPMTLAQGDTASLVIEYAPTLLGTSAAILNIYSDDPEITRYVIFMNGNCVPQSPPKLECSVVQTGTLDFGNVRLTAFSTRTVTLSNSGDSMLLVSNPVIAGAQSGDYSFVSGSGPHIIASGQTVAVTLRFSPAALGASLATLQISSNDPVTNPYMIFLKGNGLPAKLLPQLTCSVIDSGMLDFDTASVGGSSMRRLLLRSTGDSTLRINTMQISGTHAADFSIVSGGGTHVIAPGYADTATLRFAPSASGIRTAELLIQSNDSTKQSYLIRLKGKSVTAAYLLDVRPRWDLDFGNVPVGRDSVLAVVLQNTGTATVSLLEQKITGQDTADFEIVQTAAASMLVGSTETILLRFRPKSFFMKAAVLTLRYYNTPTVTTVSVQLLGYGMSENPMLVFSVDTVDCGDVSPNLKRTVFDYANNIGAQPLVIQSFSLSGSDPSDFSSPTAVPLTIAPMDRTWVQFDFSPKTIGRKTATLTVLSNDPVTPLYPLVLLGRCVSSADPTISSSLMTLDFGKVQTGLSKTDSIVITNTGGADIRISAQNISGTDPTQFSIVQFVPATLAPLAGASAVLKFSPTSTGVKTAVYRITSNDPAKPQLDVTLIGNSVTDAGQAQSAPVSLALGQNYPNPVMLSTGVMPAIGFTLNSEAHVTLKLYDVLGRFVATMLEGRMPAGTHTVKMKPENFGTSLMPGVYQYTLTAGEKALTRTMVVR
jgi:hypothetical protein